MKINHSAIRGSIRFFVLTAFIASMLWRLYVIMKFGGTKDESQQAEDTDTDSYEYTDDDSYDITDDDN
jgi:hypothetical protein